MKRIFVFFFLPVVLYAKYHKIMVHQKDVTFEMLKYAENIKVRGEGYMELVVDDYGIERFVEEGIDFKILIKDMEKFYRERMSGVSNFGAYYTYQEAISILDSLHLLYPSLCSERIALPNDESDTTWNGNKIWAIKISDNVEVEEDEPEVLYTGVHHAREPIGCNITVEFARWLLENYKNNEIARYIVDNREIWIVPIVNPDGYLYNEAIAPQGGGMWRKNRRDNGDGTYGVDLNRNYPYMWGYDDIGSSGDPSSDIYRGPSPASEPEVQSIINLCTSHSFRFALNYHSFSNMLLYPFSYKEIETPDSLAYRDMGEDITLFNYYTYGTSWQLLYLVNGDSDDWMYGEQKNKTKIFAFTPEVGEEFWEEDSIPVHIEETRYMNIHVALAAAGFLKLYSWEILTEDEDEYPEKGERLSLILTIKNISPWETVYSSVISLTLSEEFIQFDEPTKNIQAILPLAEERIEFRGKVSDDCPSGKWIWVYVNKISGRETFPKDSILLVIGEREVSFYDDFENGLVNWGGNWQLTSEDFHSPSYSLTDSPGTKYGNNRNYITYLKTPVDVDDYSYIEISFFNKYSTERGYDFGVVEISWDGENWERIYQVSGYKEWYEVKLPITEIKGDKLHLRFRLSSDRWVRDDGWYIDDVKITGVRKEQEVSVKSWDREKKRIKVVKIYDVSGRIVGIGKKVLLKKRFSKGIYFIKEGKNIKKIIIY